MSEHLHLQISEFVDDEMSAEECNFFVRRLQRDQGARARYLRYQLIGAAMRGEHIRAPAELPFTQSARPSAGLLRAGIAAAVVVAAIIGLVSGDSMRGLSGTGEDSQLTSVQADVTGVQYLIHHMGTSSGLNRALMHSSVFSVLESEAEADSASEDDPIE